MAIITKDLARAVFELRAGNLVALPTETVYGLAADALNEKAVEKIFKAKGRPSDHPLIVHVGSPGWIAELVEDVPELAQKLIDRFWPGPLTIVLEKSTQVLDIVTAGQNSVALRMPQHADFLNIVNAFGRPVVAPSANRFESISPTTAYAVVEELGAQVSAVFDGGQCSVGIESTIVEIKGKNWRLLRPGHIRAAQISQLLGKEAYDEAFTHLNVSGNRLRHYAPKTQAVWIASKKVNDWICMQLEKQKRIVCLSYSTALKLPVHPKLTQIQLPSRARGYAQHFYTKLRDADNLAPDYIVIEAPPKTPYWVAVWDRLKKAATPG